MLGRQAGKLTNAHVNKYNIMFNDMKELHFHLIGWFSNIKHLQVFLARIYLEIKQNKIVYINLAIKLNR